jgi:hypothetical protein
MIGLVNPLISATLSRCTGYTTADDGTRTPTYDTTTVISIQLQAMDEGEVRQINELNISGTVRKVYTKGTLSSLDRNAGTGGDLLVFSTATWLVVHTFEQWPDWVAVAVQKQVS